MPVAPLSFIDDGSNEELSATTFFTLGDSFEDSATGTQAGSETLALTIVQGSTREQPPQTRARRARQANADERCAGNARIEFYVAEIPDPRCNSFGGFGPIFSIGIEANNGLVLELSNACRQKSNDSDLCSSTRDLLFFSQTLRVCEAVSLAQRQAAEATFPDMA